MSKRIKTKYPGVFWIEGLSAGGKSERIYYILYRKNGKLIEEPVGRQFQDDMTPARAALIRTRRIEGDDLSNKEILGKVLGKPSIVSLMSMKLQKDISQQQLELKKLNMQNTSAPLLDRKAHPK